MEAREEGVIIPEPTKERDAGDRVELSMNSIVGLSTTKK